MSTQVTTTLFSIDELSSDAQARALDKLREKEYNTDHEWWEYMFDAHKEALGYIGFYDVDISFSGFHSQGDGASFTARYDSIDINMDKLLQQVTYVFAKVSTGSYDDARYNGKMRAVRRRPDGKPSSIDTKNFYVPYDAHGNEIKTV